MTPDTKARREQLYVRVTEEEKRKVEAVAELDGVTTSDLLREKVRETVEKYERASRLSAAS